MSTCISSQGEFSSHELGTGDQEFTCTLCGAFDEDACMVKAAELFSHFLYIESCNQCPPCKIGSRRITGRLDDLMAMTASRHDVEDIAHTATWVTNAQRCNLATSEQIMSSSVVAAFPEEFQDHVNASCSRRHDLTFPKIIGYEEGKGFTFDTEYSRKQPDWTYA